MSASRIETRYEVVNSLGRLNADRPYLAERVMQATEFAKAVVFMLRTLDGYQDRSGEDLETIARHIRAGRIEVRCNGNSITVVTPG